MKKVIAHDPESLRRYRLKTDRYSFCPHLRQSTWNEMLRVKNRDIHTIHGRLRIPSPGVESEKLNLSRNGGKASKHGDGDFY